jgi:hypothetical protein
VAYICLMLANVGSWLCLSHPKRTPTEGHFCPSPASPTRTLGALENARDTPNNPSSSEVCGRFSFKTARRWPTCPVAHICLPLATVGLMQLLRKRSCFHPANRSARSRGWWLTFVRPPARSKHITSPGDGAHRHGWSRSDKNPAILETLGP